MIPIDLETFQMLHHSFHEKKGKKEKGSLPRTGLKSSPQLRKALKGWELIQKAMEEACHGRFRKC